MATSRRSLGVHGDSSQPTDDAGRELFEACRNGDINKVKHLIGSHNVNAKDTAGRKSSPLHFAAGFGRKDVVEYLLHCGANVHARDDGGLIPLHNACSFGHAEVVQLLLRQGADANARDNWNYTPLHEAAIKGKIDVCIVLLQHGADPNIRNTDGKTPLDLADPSAKSVLIGEYKKDELLESARSGSEEKMVSLITPLNVNCHASDGRKLSIVMILNLGIRVCRIAIIHHLKMFIVGLVPLHNACSYGHFEVTELLLKHGASVNAMDLWQFTPLHEAASKNRVEVCSLLLAHGADPTLVNCHSKSALDVAPSRELQERMHFSSNVSGSNGYTVPFVASLEGSRQADITRVKKYLTSEVANFKHPYTGDTPLHCAVASPFLKKKQVTEALIRKGANLNDKNKDFLTPLHVAADKNHYEVNALDGLGQTALHRVAAQGNMQACRLLLQYGVDPSISDKPRFLADDVPLGSSDVDIQLLEAAKAGDMELIKELISANPHAVNCRDLDGRHSTPLHFAGGYNRVAVVEFLLKHGADVQAKDKGGLVPLHNACSYGHYEVTQLLIEHGADVNKKNRDGHTPLDLVKEGDQDVADLLRGTCMALLAL
ncbi:hypothetical protein LSH36_912g01016 [Paralvinella palmiformis]|uniref:Uncharacterized protein n=1 Tax=Paralvinella palmiformis TaxID=53620 RepID=A0AAD9IYA9_9ANNE|nr:hypothetical protein LSH36_912g01016 [Paralvinella palmiformis]